MNRNKKSLSSSSEIKSIYNNNSSKNKSNSIYNQDESIQSKKYLKKECLFINTSKNKNNILNIKKDQRNIKNNNQDNLYENINLYYKNLTNDKNNCLRKSFDNNNSAPNIYLYNNKNSSNINRKKFISNYLKKIRNNYNLNEFKNLSSKKDLDYIIKDNSFNNNKNNYSSKNNAKILPFNAANKTFNNNINNKNISLNTSIPGENLNIEKFKVQQKLFEYRKLIDRKINELIKDKKKKLNKNSEIENKTPKNKLYRKSYKSKSMSDFGRNKRKLIKANLNNTNYKNINNESSKNIQNKITIIPKRIIDYEQRNALNPISNSKNKIKKLVNNANIQGKLYLDSYNEMMNKKNIF